MLFGTTLPDYRLLKARNEGHYEVVEGIVVDFHPQMQGQREYERFTVGGVTFIYTQYNSTLALNESVGAGGPIRPGMHLRIGHIGGRIVLIDKCM
jgi:hypothetical protein